MSPQGFPCHAHHGSNAPGAPTALPNVPRTRWVPKALCASAHCVVNTVPHPRQETLFILERAPLFGTKAGGVYQVIDNGGSGGSAPYLQNVITFPPEGAFIVDSSIITDGPQRTAFTFNSAKLKLPGGRALGLPPFGKGWFDNVYLDDTLRWVHAV